MFPFNLLLLLVSFHATPAQPQCSPVESSALLGINPKLSSGVAWNASEDCCTWYGVDCDPETSHVIGLTIDDSVNPGEITSNSTLFSLRRLKRLEISVSERIRIDVAIFESLALNMTSLTELYFEGNDLSSVPLTILTSLTSSLTSLQLRDCLLRGELLNISSYSFPSLKTLDLSKNQLSGGVPKNFFRSLPVLVTLDLSSSNLGGQFPSSFFHSKSLVSLSLKNNNFQGPLPEFGFPPNLMSLQLDFNSIEGPIPPWIYALQNLKELALDNNRFSGEISEFETTSLTSLSLDHNQLRGVIPKSIFRQPNLTHLDLASNSLTGSLDFGGILMLKKLHSLDISSNNLSSFSFMESTNHSALQHNMNLTYLDISKNQISGAVPKVLWEIGKDCLERLDLSYNSLTHIDPLPWNNLQSLVLDFNLFSAAFPVLTAPQLWSFSAANNHFSGEYPLSICNLTSLRDLDLSYNNISGKIPRCMSNLSSLEIFSLRGNKLHGTVLANMSNNMWFLDLSSNFFMGPSPIPLKSQFLLLSKNSFTGGIPESVCSMERLRMLDVSDNELSGTIPRCMGNISDHLSVIDLQRNNFHGTIPMVFSWKSKLTSLHLDGNRFSRALPRSLENCTKLEILDLGDNLLNDTFPSWLESLPNLQVLVLRVNRFHGPIGNSTTKSPFLKLIIMDLSGNKFIGELPIKYFVNFQAMQTGPRSTDTRYVGVKMGYRGYYQDSLVVSAKGSYFELVKILIMFTVLDFSANNFTGEIPPVVGKLDSLKGLNLSHNSLGGSIPSSMRNLTNLEWLDLSTNQLEGHIPAELVNIPGLSFLNLSHNRLTGPIPNGKQFNTFTNDSYIGNLGLCGFPISETCVQSPRTNLKAEDDDDDDESDGLSIWKIAVMGFASGFVIGISIGYMSLFTDNKLSWLCEQIPKELRRKRTRPNRRISHSLL